MKRRRLAVIAALVAVPVLALRPARAVCIGDCGADGAVTIEDLVRGVAIALGSQPLASCAAFDGDGDGLVGIAELVRGVSAALSGCATAPSPTAPAPDTPTATTPPAPATATAPPVATATATRPPEATSTAIDTATFTATATATAIATATATATASATATAIATATDGPGGTPRPNVLIINLDDARADGVDRIPVLDRLAAQGVTFSNSFVPNSVCAPSRVSLLTGLYSAHHGTRAVGGVNGGADTFRVGGADQQTIATWLRAAGYTTGLFGKYLNDYRGAEATAGAGGGYYVPPGWDRWQAMASPEQYGGVNGGSYALVDEAGAVTAFDDHASDAQYSTDVLGQRLRDFIDAALTRGVPFLAVYTPVAPHVGTVDPDPAQRHASLFSDLPPWRPPSWNEADLADKPRWLSLLMPDPFGGGFTDTMRTKAYRSLMAVDEQLTATLDLLAARGAEADTLVLVTSDNGVMWGEHRAFAQRKENAYEEAIRVPLVVRYPRLTGEAAFTRSEPALNIDIAPTVADVAGVTPPAALDGESLVPLLAGAPDPQQRSDFLLEHFRSTRGDSLAYAGQPRDGDRVRLLYGPARQRPRPAMTYEFDAGDGGVAPGARAVAIGGSADATFANLASAIRSTVPSLAVGLQTSRQALVVSDPAAPDGALFLVDVDQGAVISQPESVPQFYGVRDVFNAYTYVEYETEEVELYDLAADPWQLDNRADDPAYAGLRASLAARLRALLGE